MNLVSVTFRTGYNLASIADYPTFSQASATMFLVGHKFMHTKQARIVAKIAAETVFSCSFPASGETQSLKRPI